MSEDDLESCEKVKKIEDGFLSNKKNIFPRMSEDDLEGCEKVRSLLALLVQTYKYLLTGAKVQILTLLKALRKGQVGQGTQFTCYTGTNVQMLTRELVWAKCDSHLEKMLTYADVC